MKVVMLRSNGEVVRNAGNKSSDELSAFQFLLVLQGPVRRTGKGPRTGPDCNRFKRTNGPGPLNFF